jgi:two-component system, cell cycle response regulator
VDSTSTHKLPAGLTCDTASSIEVSDLFVDGKRPSLVEDSEDTAQLLRLDLPVAPTVLIVDDDELVLSRLRELVEMAGYHVRTAANGIDALNSLQEAAASIVVTDLNMPGMDGLELCRRVREQARRGYVYIVLLTVRDGEKDILAGLDAGADDYVSKRTTAAQFTARLRIAKRILSLEYSLKIALDKKRQMAMTDSLTATYNRRYLTRRLGRELKRAQRLGGDVSLLLIDIDHFKNINDAYGHAVGDMVLKRLTRNIVQCLQRTTDYCARLGGEEFAVVLEGTHLAEARICAERIRRSVENASIETAAGVVRITISIGVTALTGSVNRNSATLQSLLESADTNLYASKANGRNCVTSSNTNDAAISPRKHASQRLHHAKEKHAISSLR